MKVLLISPSFRHPSKRTSSYPAGLCWLSSSLTKNGYDVEVRSFLWDEYNNVKQDVQKLIEEYNPDIIGISIMSTNRTAGFEIAKLSKEINPKIKVIVGGPHVHSMWHQIIDNFSFIDFAVIGEGEITIVELADAIKNKSSIDKFNKIKGIAFKYNNEIVRTEPRELMKDLDSLPLPEHNRFAENIRENKIAYVCTSRGCPIACRFCSTSVIWGKLIRYRSIENVMIELKQIKKEFPEVSKIYFLDDEMILNKKRIIDFCEAYVKEKINMSFECVGRVSSIDNDVIKALKKAGCVRLDFGVESGSSKIIKNIGKGITNEQVINAYNLCKKYNIRAGIFLMCGLPGETKETIKETINLLKQIPSADMSIPALFTVFPGNSIYKDAVKKGFITDDFWLTDKSAPFFVLENSKRKLTWWAIKTALYHKYYRGELFSFLYNYVKRLRIDKIKRIMGLYIKK